MKTYTVRFQQMAPGRTKKVPVMTPGIEVGYGQVVNGLAVSLGAPAAKLWEVPLMRGNFPLVSVGAGHNGTDMVFDCHPVPNLSRDGRYFLAKEQSGVDRVLVRFSTEAGEQAVPSGAVVVKEGNALRIGYGYTVNRQDAKSADILLDVHPGAKLVLTAGGTGGELHQRYLVEHSGDGIQISPLAESPAMTVALQLTPVKTAAEKPVALRPTGGQLSYRKPIPAASAPAWQICTKLPDDLDAALEAAQKMSPEELADTVCGRMKGVSVRRPDQLVAA